MARCLILLLLTHVVKQCGGKMDCAMSDFSGATTKAYRVFCGDGYHECGQFGDGCCSDIEAFPVELTLVILGPAAALASCLLTVFVLKIVISGTMAKGRTSSRQIDIAHIVQ